MISSASHQDVTFNAGRVAIPALAAGATAGALTATAAVLAWRATIGPAAALAGCGQYIAFLTPIAIVTSGAATALVVAALMLRSRRRTRGVTAGPAIAGEEASLRPTLEAQLRQAQKMEAIGRLAGGVAHDFNNILTVILGHAEVLADDEELPAGLRDSVAAIRDAGERAARLTRQLLTFSRHKPVAAQRIDLNDVVTGIEPMVRRLVGEDISVEVAAAPGGAPVVADAGHIEQILMNLVANARDAMPGGGSLTIEVANTRFSADHRVRHGVLKRGDYVMLAVSDTGCGIERQLQDRVFEPFFTTKESSKGTGLGLSTVYGIAVQHGGHVEVYSEPGEGTTLKVYLPRLDRIPDADQTRPLAGSETILVIEDDDEVRNLLRETLQHHGYTVIEARDGDEALLCSARYAGGIDAAITDVIMPGMNGVAVFDELRRQRPMLRALFMSGYPDHTVGHHAPLDNRAFLRKPFSTETAVARLRQLLQPDPAPEEPASAA